MQIHQVLHGYRGGHGKLAASLRLSQRDSDLITRLSDLSGHLTSGVELRPYLTTYPLPSRRYFALARTWPDLQAPRAGCVLTHTLLIPADRWATESNVRLFDSLFVHPQDVSEETYRLPIEAGHDHVSNVVSQQLKVAEPGAAAFVSRYFAKSLRPIIWFDANDPEACLWQILEGIWPKLRSVFSCCTYGLQQRAREDGPFDLIFAPSVVYARFTRLPAEQLIESTTRQAGEAGEAEEWMAHWRKILFGGSGESLSSEGALSDTDRLVWNELSEDPGSIRRLFLVSELRLRSLRSPTAGVGSIDVVESLARDPDTAVVLKHEVFVDAISAAAAALDVGEAFKSLRLMDERLRRDSFRSVATECRELLSTATAGIAGRKPEAAVEVATEVLDEATELGQSGFVDGIVRGLRKLAETEPSRLGALVSHPEVAAELLRLEPSFGGRLLEVGGYGARQRLARWLATVRDSQTRRRFRIELLRFLSGPDDIDLLSELLRDVNEGEVAECLSVLDVSTSGFEDKEIRRLAADRLGVASPRAVREWARQTREWSGCLAALVAATYTTDRRGVLEIVKDSRLGCQRWSDVLAAFVEGQNWDRLPYWFREVSSENAEVVGVLLMSGQAMSELTERILLKLLHETQEIPIAQSAELLAIVPQLEGRLVFPAVVNATMRSIVGGFVADKIASTEARAFLGSTIGCDWLKSIRSAELVALLAREASGGGAAAGRAWKWLSDAPTTVYEREEVAPEIAEALLRCIKSNVPNGVERDILQVVRRARLSSSENVRVQLSSGVLRFALDNVRLPFGSVVAEAFPVVYREATRDQRSNLEWPNLIAGLFRIYDWDRGKELRVALVDSFVRSRWEPGDLAIAASNAGILRKVFKRLYRRSHENEYAKAMLNDLIARDDPRAKTVAGELRHLLEDPDFYEEWD